MTTNCGQGNSDDGIFLIAEHFSNGPRRFLMINLRQMTNSHRLLPTHPSVFLGEGAKIFFLPVVFLLHGFMFDICSG